MASPERCDKDRKEIHAFINKKHEGDNATFHIEHYRDDGYSKTTLERPALQRLIADVKAGDIHHIVVINMSCLTRSFNDYRDVTAILKRHHVALESIEDFADNTTAAGRLLLSTSSILAEFSAENGGGDTSNIEAENAD
jgi:site-specific DNA recombinase